MNRTIQYNNHHNCVHSTLRIVIYHIKGTNIVFVLLYSVLYWIMWHFVELQPGKWYRMVYCLRLLWMCLTKMYLNKMTRSLNSICIDWTQIHILRQTMNFPVTQSNIQHFICHEEIFFLRQGYFCSWIHSSPRWFQQVL